jgi:hypothetical protein
METDGFPVGINHPFWEVPMFHQREGRPRLLPRHLGAIVLFITLVLWNTHYQQYHHCGINGRVYRPRVSPHGAVRTPIVIVVVVG